MSIYVARPTIMYDDRYNFREVYAVEAFQNGKYVQYAGADRLKLESAGRVLTGETYFNPESSAAAVADMGTIVKTLEADGWKILNKF